MWHLHLQADTVLVNDPPQIVLKLYKTANSSILIITTFRTSLFMSILVSMRRIFPKCLSSLPYPLFFPRELHSVTWLKSQGKRGIHRSALGPTLPAKSGCLGCTSRPRDPRGLFLVFAYSWASRSNSKPGAVIWLCHDLSRNSFGITKDPGQWRP
jgi:hypothetical protein